MSELRVFLKAEWRSLVMLNYAVDPRLLRARAPIGTTLDFFEGKTYVSLVGFRFLETRVLGVAVPFHCNFDEVNLRFYVRRCEGGTVRRGTVFIREKSNDRLQVVAAVLAKSVALAQYENDVTATFDRIEPFAIDLERGGKGRRDMKLLLRHIGLALRNEHKMVARVEVSDRPELLWDHPELEQLYLRLEDEFEIEERAAILDRKLELISRTVETILDLLQKEQSMRVEWYIVILILVEIFLSLYTLFAH